MEDLLTREEIVSLVAGNIPKGDTKKLVYSQVFPFEYNPDTIEEGKTFIFCDVDIQKAINKTYLIPALYIWVITHKSKLRLPEGGVRVDKLCSKIASAISGSHEYGLGELELFSVKRFAPMTDYMGKVMTFYAKDFNRLHDPNKSIPENRRRG